MKILAFAICMALLTIAMSSTLAVGLFGGLWQVSIGWLSAHYKLSRGRGRRHG